MPSPFPGMDPYLEGSEWSSVHHELSSEIARQLAPKLAPKYMARTVRRFAADEADEEDVAISMGGVSPDVGIYGGTAVPITQAAIAVAPAAPLEIENVLLEREPQVTIEIRDVKKRQLVTAIEVLSPKNKRSDGYQKYVEKRQNLLSSHAHLLEIDLLRKGKRVPLRQPLPSAAYFVFLSRVERRPIAEVWPIQLVEPLPIVPVPLLRGDADVWLDLQAALTAAYDAYRYDLSVDYTQPPEAPLEGDDARWADTLLMKTRFAKP